MAQAVRERIPEMGVMLKAIGFAPLGLFFGLVMGESVLLRRMFRTCSGGYHL